ncbi:hypothetical protein ACIBEJ_25075 [Nonomuraea sp. NPDC050790]|uniref:hypothetical protein n=1 Tax=Nonomuraea sp. NPDC050790 TaxID=3364371 RepID=UPI0037A3D227
MRHRGHGLRNAAPKRTLAVAGGKHIVPAAGDHVRVRKNDYRAAQQHRQTISTRARHAG